MRQSVRMIAVLSAAAAGVGGIGAATTSAAASDTAPMMAYLGLPDLIAQFGANLERGQNVHVSLVEASTYPVLTDGRFAGKTLTRTSTFTTVETTAGHATNVGARFFGNETGFSQRSVAPAIPNVQLYSYSEFQGSYLKSPGTPEPYGSPNRSQVASHAYAENNSTLDSIARLDYLVQRDDFSQVVASRQYSTQGNSFNGIIVAPAQGTTGQTTAVGSGTAYVAGRTSPTVTGPLTGAGSDSIGQVAGVVALLTSRGKTTSSIDQAQTRDTFIIPGTYSGGTFGPAVNQPGVVVRAGETSEVIKAALMAGALRDVPAYSNGAVTVPAISDYRVDAANRSTNGLDHRYGAGMVSALQSYRIVNAGEVNSAQDGSLGGAIGQYGFDYDPSFGGASGSNAQADYGFTADASGKFIASLVWNLKVDGAATVGGNFSSAHTLHNLSLKLIDVTAGGTVVALSDSSVDNTQNVWVDLVAGHTYTLSVTRGGGDFEWDYGLAWRSEVALTPTAVPEPAAAGAVLMSAGVLLRRRRV